MTLVEVVAALAIVALLAVAAMRTVTRLARASAQRRDLAGGPSRTLALRELLETDLGHAQRVHLTRAGFEVETLARLAPGSMALEHLRATVAYEVRTVGPTTCLLRIQTAEGARPLAELVARDVRAVTLKADGQAQPRKDRWTAVPDALTVTVTPAPATGGAESLTFLRK